MNILLLTAFYPPEVRSCSHLMKEMAQGLQARGHNVTVLTQYPPNDTLEMKSQQASLFVSSMVEEGIRVVRVKTLSRYQANYFIRGIAELILPYLFYRAARKVVLHKIDVVIAYSPPLTLSVVAKKIKKRDHAIYVLNVQDIFPQNAIDLGIIKNSAFKHFYEMLERMAYAYADKITVHSSHNRNFLIDKKKVLPEKVYTIFNWIDLKPYQKIKQRTGRFRDCYGLQDKFIFLFAGVMGPSQGLDFLVEVACRVKPFRDIAFLLVGGGSALDSTRTLVEQRQAINVFFQPFISQEEYPELVKDADVGVVCLSSLNKTPVVPGKLMGYMAAAIPVVAWLNKESDGHAIIQEAQCGYSVVSDNIEKAVNIVERVYREKDQLSYLGANGFRYATAHFERDMCMRQLEQLFCKN